MRKREMYSGIAVFILGNGTSAGLQVTGIVNPKLGWMIIGVSTFIGLILFIMAFRVKELNHAQNITDSTRQSIREYRQEFNSKKQIPNQLLALDTYLGNEVKQQDLSGEDFMVMVRSWVHWYDYPKLFFLGLVYPFSITRRIFTKTAINTILGLSVKFNAALKEQELGTLPIIDSDENYKKIYDEIIQLEDGLPIYIITKINRFIFISIALNAWRIVGREKTFWEELVGTNKFWQNYLKFGQNNISLMLLPLDNALIALRSEIAQDIERYFTVVGEL